MFVFAKIEDKDAAAAAAADDDDDHDAHFKNFYGTFILKLTLAKFNVDQTRPFAAESRDKKKKRN